MVADLPWDDNERELNALYEIIGRLVVEYARAEAYVYLLAGRVLGNDTVGSVVFDGMRLVDLAKRIRGMLRANDAADHDYADIDACLVQLAEIGKNLTETRTPLCRDRIGFNTNPQPLHRQDSRGAGNRRN